MRMRPVGRRSLRLFLLRLLRLLTRFRHAISGLILPEIEGNCDGNSPMLPGLRTSLRYSSPAVAGVEATSLAPAPQAACFIGLAFDQVVWNIDGIQVWQSKPKGPKISLSLLGYEFRIILHRTRASHPRVCRSAGANDASQPAPVDPINSIIRSKRLPSPPLPPFKIREQVARSQRLGSLIQLGSFAAIVGGIGILGGGGRIRRLRARIGSASGSATAVDEHHGRS